MLGMLEFGCRVMNVENCCNALGCCVVNVQVFVVGVILECCVVNVEVVL